MRLKGANLHYNFSDIGGVLFRYARCLHFFPRQYNDNKQCSKKKRCANLIRGWKGQVMHFCQFTRFLQFFLRSYSGFLIFPIKQCSVRHRGVQIFIICVFVRRNVSLEFAIVCNYYEFRSFIDWLMNSVMLYSPHSYVHSFQSVFAFSIESPPLSTLLPPFHTPCSICTMLDSLLLLASCSTH